VTASADVVVHAATSAGVCAAVAAARAGASVQLLERGRHVGGMTSGGLGWTDLGDPRVVGGMAARFHQEVAEVYGVAVGTYAGPEPHVAEAILTRWLVEAGVDVRLGADVVAVDVRGGRITGLTTAAGDRFEGGVVVDASYEGDVMALAGVPYAVGREDRELYGERFAGRQEVVPGRHTMPPWISPFADAPPPGVVGRVLPQVKPEPMVDVGRGDGGVMSYGYRVCLTTADDRLPCERRDGYDEDYWELARRLFDHWRRTGTEVTAGRLIGLTPNLPGGKCDANSLGPMSLSVLDGAAWEYPEASPARREELRLHHLHHAQDLLWFLGHDPCVPRHVRAELQRWGLPRDEFADTGHLPHQLYVREARRMLGERVLTEHDVVAGRRRPDVVALGSYNIDVREVQRAWRWVHEFDGPLAMVFTEGYLSVPVPPYAIGYGSIVPRRTDCTNLLVPVCVSASHVAFASVRMEVQYQMLGHAAGLAAAAAVAGGCDVQAVDVAALQDRLHDEGQVLAV
jgi:hypothetical protein